MLTRMGGSPRRRTQMASGERDLVLVQTFSRPLVRSGGAGKVSAEGDLLDARQTPFHGIFKPTVRGTSEREQLEAGDKPVEPCA